MAFLSFRRFLILSFNVFVSYISFSMLQFRFFFTKFHNYHELQINLLCWESWLFKVLCCLRHCTNSREILMGCNMLAMSVNEIN